MKYLVLSLFTLLLSISQTGIAGQLENFNSTSLNNTIHAEDGDKKEKKKEGEAEPDCD